MKYYYMSEAFENIQAQFGDWPFIILIIYLVTYSAVKIYQKMKKKA